MGKRRGRGMSRAWGIGGVTLLATGVVIISGLALGQGRDEASSKAGSVPTLSESSPRVTAEPLRVAAVGDSITAADSRDFAGGDIGDGSWLSYVLGDGVVFSGGWALGGVQTRSMVENVTPYPDTDVLVLLAGVNDYGNNVPFSTTAANYDAIVGTVAPARVLVSTVPPSDEQPAASRSFNEDLEELAATRGWSFVDAASGTQDVDGTYIEGFTSDGTHPTPAAAKVMGEAVRKAVLAESS
ncbi:SGNH/GDSL hydrolase family protein [Clavibacter sp. Sh2036]|uniref:SGNH/GDSL hydrolase family protein n=1 Tax=unclassified Clavibacter TaxID=2626594 RepID=UPI0022EA6AFF|nr:SGNH/GDSL hydrolase family protein [Clavibacter sp. CT19]